MNNGILKTTYMTFIKIKRKLSHFRYRHTNGIPLTIMKQFSQSETLRVTHITIVMVIMWAPNNIYNSNDTSLKLYTKCNK